MKATDLMIGDWVIAYGKKTQVVWVGNIHKLAVRGFPSEFYEDEIEPIPLTKDILIRNGFDSLTDEMFSACETETYSNQELKIYLSHIGCEYNPVQLVVYMGYEPQEKVVLRMMPCRYVHELQHAFRLCKVEKEIEL